VGGSSFITTASNHNMAVVAKPINSTT